MYGKRWKKKKRASRWWKDNVFSPPLSGSGKWKNTWSEKRRKKRAAWQAAFDYLPDLDAYDTLRSTLPLIGFSNRQVSQLQRMTHHDGNGICMVFGLEWSLLVIKRFAVDSWCAELCSAIMMVYYVECSCSSGYVFTNFSCRCHCKLPPRFSLICYVIQCHFSLFFWCVFANVVLQLFWNLLTQSISFDVFLLIFSLWFFGCHFVIFSFRGGVKNLEPKLLVEVAQSWTVESITAVL